MSASLRSSPSTTPQRWFLTGLVLLFLALGVRYSFKVLDDRSAFRRWQPQLQQLGEGVDIARQFNYPNPPIMAVLLEPLALLPPVVGALVWFFLKAALAILSLYWIFRLIETSDLPFPPWARGLTVLLSLKPILDDLNHGNVNLFIFWRDICLPWPSPARSPRPCSSPT
jgi:alpha-1,2-mannosyltransferase